MSQYARRAGGVTRSLVAAARSENVTFVAASLAYYAFVSLLPLLLLSLVAVSLIAGPAGADEVAGQVQETLGPAAGDQVHDALTSAAGRSGATLVGLAVLFWSGLKVFRGLDIAFSQMYGSRVPESMGEQLLDGIVVLAAVGVGVVLTVAVGAFLASTGLEWRLAGVDLVSIAGGVALVIGLSVMLLPLYYVFPDRELRLREALPGAAFTAVGWTLLQTGFRVYAAHAGAYDAYGVIAGGLLLVTLLYFGGIVLLLGAVLNAVLAGRVGAAGPVDIATGRPTAPRAFESMTDDDQADTTGTGEAPDEQSLEAELEALRAEIDERTVHRDEVERDLRRYVRRRIRRGHARGWGPYLVLLYGSAMTLGAFYLLEGGWAILAMFVVWTSTLGLYVLMLLVGVGLNLAGVPGRLRDLVQERR